VARVGSRRRHHGGGDGLFGAQPFANMSKFYPRAQYIHATLYDFFPNADSVHVVSSSSGSGQIQAMRYISCIFEAKFFINCAIKSVTLLAHAVFVSANSSSRPSESKNSAVVDKLRNASTLLPHHLELTMIAIETSAVAVRINQRH